MKNRHLLFLFLLFVVTSSYSQKWTKVENNSFRSLAEKRWNTPLKYESYALDVSHFETVLNNAPDRFESNGTGILINWPMPGGKMQIFSIKRSDVLHPDLAAKFPEIKAFTGHSTSDPTAVLKISMSHKGIEGMLLSSKHETVYLDRYLPKSKEEYILYKKSDYNRVLAEGVGTCTVKESKGGEENQISSVRFGDCQLRKYRLALACTGEYATFHGGNVPDVMAEFNASMIRVNGIYERELAITMELIPDNDQLIFLNGGIDPYTNNDGEDMLDQNQVALDQIIGFNNYDIGHVYSTGGGGIASIRSPCTSRKAQGVTGLPNPTGDQFWVDYVAHEMGHQFGANHTQNNSCQRFGNTAVEPGSGSTIMGYAGICSPNVQNNSDDYFHSVSQNEIANFVIAGNGGCSEMIPLDNSAPEIITLPQTGQVLPIQTPFLLTAEAIDADNDLLTYCWEQIDNDVAPMPPSTTSTDGPAFRSMSPSESPTRYFPALPSILFGINGTTWERLPSVDREMNFNLTVRDNNPLGGCTDDEAMMVSFTSLAGPFTITAPNTFQTWNAGETETITWDVARTDVAPVSCENVDILLSLDFGRTFDIVLAENVDNDGEHTITVPYQRTTQGRIMVKCSDMAFFDINDRNFNILAPFASTITPSELTICPNASATFEIDYTGFESDPNPVSFTLNGLPSGATFNFSPSQTSEDTTVILTIDNINTDHAGTYELEVITQGATDSFSGSIYLTIEADENVQIDYLTPENGEISVTIDATLSWEELTGIHQYEVELSDSPGFDNIVFAASTMDNFVNPSGLESLTIYYWRVRGVSSCIDPIWQGVQSFQTRILSCESGSASPNELINTSASNNIESEIELVGEDVIQDIVVNVEINHSWVGDLVVTLRAPDGTEAILFDRPGFPATTLGCDQDDIVATFSSSAVNTAQDFESTCNLLGDAIRGTYRPLESFSIFENKPTAGVWTLIVDDSFQGDGGRFISWSIENCESSFIDPGVILKNNLLALNEEVMGTINSDLLEVENSDPVNTLFIMRSLPSSGEVQRMNPMSGVFETMSIGDHFTQEEVNSNRVRYVLTESNVADDQFFFDTRDDQIRYTNDNIFLISTGINVLVLNASITRQISCFGETDGRIEADAVGGTPDYEYSLNDQPFQTSGVFEDLAAGDYVIKVRDDEGVIAESQILTMIEPTQVTVSSVVSENTITLIGSGGTGEYVYSLNEGPFTDDNVFSDLPDGDYTGFIVDSNGCEGSQSSIIVSSSTKELSLDQLSLFPNPTTNSFTLGSATELELEFEIRDITGQLIIKGKTLTNNPISAEYLVPGLYIVKVTYNKYSKLYKMSRI